MRADDEDLAEYDRRLAAGDLAGALHLARRLAAAEHHETSRHGWSERCAELRPCLRDACRLAVVYDEAALSDLLRSCSAHQRSTLWLDDDGRRLVVVDSLGGWLFIRVVDLAVGRILERVSLRPPAPLERPVASFLDGDRLWVAGMHGGVLELRAGGDWDVLGWYPTLELVPRGHTIDFAVVLPGKDFLWMIVRDPEDRPEVYAVDLPAWRVTARIPGSPIAQPLIGPDAPRVLASDTRHGTRIYEQDGTPSGAERLLGRHVSTAAQSPDGQGLVVMTTRGLWLAESGAVADDDPLVTDRVKDTGVVLLLIEEGAHGASRVVAELDLGDAMVLGDHCLATAVEAGLVFAFVTREGNRGEILAIAVERDGEAARLAIAYRAGVPLGSLLLSDRHARHAVVLAFGDETAEVVRLGRETPRVDTPSVPSGELERTVEALEGEEPERVRRLLGALRTADRLVAAGAPAAARDLLDRPEIWRWADQQSAARLAAIYVETPVVAPADRFAKRLALARFLTLYQELDERLLRQGLVLPGLTWERPRLDEIALRARGWLAGG